MSYKVEMIERKDPIVQLEASKLSIKDLFNNLLNETKGLKYQFKYSVKYSVNQKRFCNISLFKRL